MKILIIQENGRHKENKRFRECFALQGALITLGEECDVWGLGHDNFNAAMNFNSYDIIINLENYDTSGWVPNLLKVRGFKILWSIDAHCRGAEVYNGVFDKGNYDLMLQATKDYVDHRSMWFPNCYDDTLIQPLDVAKKYNVGFCGNIANRGGWINEIEKEVGIKKDIFVIGNSMVEAINSYKIHFNRNIANDINYRSFETLGCGTVLATNYNSQYDELGFIDGDNCILYRNKDDLIKKIKNVLLNHELRFTIEKNGLELAKKHTYIARAKKLLKIVKENNKCLK